MAAGGVAADAVADGAAADRNKGGPVALWQPDPRVWPMLDWYERGGATVQLFVPPDDDDFGAGPGEFTAQTIRSVILSWRVSSGSAGSRRHRGVVTVLPARALPGIHLISREGHRVRERQAGLVTDPADMVVVRSVAGPTVGCLPLLLVRRAADQLGGGVSLAKLMGMSERTVLYVLSGRPAAGRTASQVGSALTRVAQAHLLEHRRYDVLREVPEVVVAAWLDEMAERSRCRHCGQAALPGKDWCSKECRDLVRKWVRATQRNRPTVIEANPKKQNRKE